MLLPILEWAAFGMSLVSAWLYGSRPIGGAIAGVLCCGLFFAYGLTAGIYAAVVANIFFLVVHLRNIRRLKMSDPQTNQNTIKRVLLSYSSEFIPGRSALETATYLRELKGLNKVRDICHGASVEAGWYTDAETGEPLVFNSSQKFNLIHSELSEALEADRKNLKDDKLPHRSGVEVELADALIRIFDLAGYLKYDLEEDFHNMASKPLAFYQGETFHEQLGAIHADVSVAWATYELNNGKSPDTRLALMTAIARILVLGNYPALDIPGAAAEKYAYNRVRPDHKIENRRGGNGKSY